MITTAIMRSIFLGAILAIVGLALPLVAQSKTGALIGSVQDQQKAFIPGAEVTLKNTETKETYKTSSNDAGEYRVQVPRGTYLVKVKLPGFLEVWMRNVKVREGKSTTLGLTTLVAPDPIRLTPPMMPPNTIPIPLSPAVPPSPIRL